VTEDELVAAIEASPDDSAQRAVYADWLEQRGDPRAELVRIEDELWRRPIDLVRFRRLYPRRLELRAQHDARWGARIARPSTAEIRHRLAILAELDPEHEQGMAELHRYALNEPLDEGQLAEIELQLGCTLPAQYRRFVCEVGDGGAGPEYGIHPIAKQPATDLATAFERPSSEDGNDQMIDRVGALEICEIGCGSFYYLVTGGPDAGSVWVRGDHGWFPELATGTWTGLTRATIIATPRSMHAEFLDWYALWLDATLWSICRARPDGDEVFDRSPAEVPHLNLQNKQLERLPDGLRKLTELVRLDLGNNPLVELPDWIGDFPKLEWLSCNHTTLKTVPGSISKLRSLKRLSLFMGRHLETLPESIGEMSWLAELDVRYNALLALPESFGNLSQLSRLDLCDNRLTTLPASIGKLRALTELSLENNLLVTLPDELAQLDQLVALNISRNRTLTTLPAVVAKLPKLETLRITYATTLDLAGAFRALAAAPSLRKLNLHMSGLSRLPEEIGLLTQLRELDLSYNRLVDVPDSLAALTQLTTLTIGVPGDNQLLWNRVRTLLPQLR
jgi:uncharacterized protein (TIGR02996 family)